MSSIYVDATEYRYLPLTVEPVDGVYPTLAVTDVSLSLVGPGHTGAWLAADRLVANGQGKWFAGLLIGPTGTVTLQEGTYLMRARVGDAPETVAPYPARSLRAWAAPS